MNDIKPLPPPDPILLWDRKLKAKPCLLVSGFDEALLNLVARLKSTCYHYNGCGLAAPQISEFVSVCVVNYPADIEPLVLVNPVIDEIRSRGEQTDFEACLSLPGATSSGAKVRSGARVMRCFEIFYSYQDVTGRRIETSATGMQARIIAHESDHLVGTYFIDRVSSVARDLVVRNHQNFVRSLQRGN